MKKPITTPRVRKKWLVNNELIDRKKPMNEFEVDLYVIEDGFATTLLTVSRIEDRDGLMG